MTSWLRPKSQQELMPQPSIHNGGVRPVHSGRDGEHRPRGATTAATFEAATRYPNSRRNNDGRNRTSVLPPDARSQSLSHKLSDLGKAVGGSPGGGGGSSREKVRMTDQDLTEHVRLQAMRVEAQVRPWTTSQSDGVAPHWSRKRDAGRLSVYTTKNESRFAIAAVGEVPCGLQDLLSLFSYSTDGEFRGLMGRLWGDHEVQDAEILRTIQSSFGGSSSSEKLRLKRLQFERSTLSAPDEEWCYLDFVQPQYQAESKLLALQGFTRTIATLHPHDVYASDQGELKRRKSKTKFGLDCVAGHHFEAMDAPSSGCCRMTRVVFYGEHKKASSSGSSRDPCALPYNTIKMRLIRLVNCTNILMDVITQRLNQQPVAMRQPSTTMRRQRVASADPSVRSISSSVSSWSSDDACSDASSVAKAAAAGAGPSTSCGVCTRLRSVGHLVCCRACGFLVCVRCSRDDENAHSHPSQENSHICKTCQFKAKQKSEPVLVSREDDFPMPAFKSRAVSQPQIGRKDSQPMAPASPPSPPPVDVGRSTLKLAGLLETTLQSADSDAKKASMLTVLKYLMDQDTQNAAGNPMNANPPKQGPIKKAHSTPSRRQNFYQAPVLAANGSSGTNQPLVQPRVARPAKKLYERPDAVYPSKVKLFDSPHDS